jgi:DNA topoisomerase-1
MAQIGAQDETEKPRYAKLRNEQRLDQITLEEALELFKLPRKLGMFEEHEINVSIGRFGPYVRLNDFFVSMKKEDDPYTVTYDRAVELILEKRKANAEKIIKTFDEDPDAQILNGRWGPYIAYKDKNVRIPKDRDPISITLAEVIEWAEKAPVAKGKRKSKTAFVPKKAVAKKRVTKTKSKK